MNLVIKVDDKLYNDIKTLKRLYPLSPLEQVIIDGIPVPEIQPIYVISHVYDVDGGFGDAVQVEDVLGFVVGAKVADEYVEKYSKPEVYDRPYSDLYHHTLIARRIDPLNVNEDPFSKEFAIEERI